MYLSLQTITLQVVELLALTIEESKLLRHHGLRRQDTDESHTLVAVGADDIGRIIRFRLTIYEEVGTYHGWLQLLHQCCHIRAAKLKLMVAQSDGIIAHCLHNINYILALGDSPYGTSLHKVTAANRSCPGCITLVDGIAQSCEFRIAGQFTMRIALKEDNNTLVCFCRRKNLAAIVVIGAGTKTNTGDIQNYRLYCYKQIPHMTKTYRISHHHSLQYEALPARLPSKAARALRKRRASAKRSDLRISTDFSAV